MASPTATSAAISSISTTWCACCSGCWRRRGVNGIFNVGTGTARSFRELILAGYAALGTKPNIEYVEMPDNMRAGYQYFTQAKTARLLAAGYNGGFTPLEDAVRQYVTGFLDKADPYR